MKAFISARAQLAAQRVDAHWRARAEEPDLFAHEFLQAIELLESITTPGSPFPTARRPELKRLLLPKSRCHIYFEVDKRAQTIRILHVWDGRLLNC